MGAVPARWSRNWFERWRSGPLDAVVLAVGRTFTSTVRLLEIVRLFEGSRVVVVWAFDPGSAFRAGAEDMVRGQGMLVVPWGQVGEVECDLAITASENTEVESVQAPIDVFGHGIGFNKVVPDSESGQERLSGVVPERYVRTRELSMIVSHQEQIDQLRATHPEAADRCVVLGDPTHDLLISSRYRRHRYRRLLGIGDRKLIVVTSTWTPDGVYGRWPDLFRRLLAELPYDEYRVAAIFHPNLSFGGDDYLDRTLTDARDGGLIVVRRDEGWHATLLSADLVIGDTGSVALYAISIDLPFLRGVAADRLVAGTPPEELARIVPVLSPDLPLREQIDMALATHRSGQYQSLADRMFAYQGDAAERVRGYLFERLGLRVPDRPAMARTAAEPHAECHIPESFTAVTRLLSAGHVEVIRYPRAAQGPDRPVPPPGYRSHSSTSEAESLLIKDASVVLDPEPATRGEAEEWLTQCLFDRPARMAAAVLDGAILVGTRDGRRFLLTVSPLPDPGLVSAAAYELLRGGALRNGTVTVTAGPVTATFRVDALPERR